MIGVCVAIIFCFSPPLGGDLLGDALSEEPYLYGLFGPNLNRKIDDVLVFQQTALFKRSIRVPVGRSLRTIP